MPPRKGTSKASKTSRKPASRPKRAPKATASRRTGPARKRRPARPESGGGPSISVGGSVAGAVIVGSRNVHIGWTGAGSSVTIAGASVRQTFDARQQARLAGAAPPEEIASLASRFEALEASVETEAPAEVKSVALEQAGELKEAVTGEPPDVGRMEQARRWFLDNLPAMVGAVTGVLAHPIVGRLVEAAGEFTLNQFRDRLGLPEAS